MPCEHKSSNSKDWMEMPNGILKLHPYCSKCGVVKNITSDRGKKLSYFISALSRLRKTLENKGYRISDAQIRLIVKELTEIEGFEDTWWITFSKQKEIFVNVVQKYIRVSKDVIESVI
jgi:hypothetical protein